MIGFTLAGAQRRAPHNLRATALVELSTDPSGAKTVRIIPIAILDGGVFNDASIYKATPEPMALDAGVVYEAQKTGQTIGYATVGRAVKGSIWTAEGRWQLVSHAPKPQPSAPPAGSPADDRPILHRGGSAAPAQGTPAIAPPTPSPSPSSSDDRIVLHPASGDAPAQSTPTPAASPSAAPSPASTPVASAPEPDDPNRPRLRHRTPQPAQDQTAEQKPQPATATQPVPAAVITSKPPGSTPGPQPETQTLVAVSDDQPSDLRSYEFAWKPGELAPMEAKLRKLALAQLPSEHPALTERSLANVVIRSFDLDLSNDAVMVLTAEIPAGHPSPPNKAGTKTAAASTSAAPSVTRYFTLIARVDFDGIPQRLATSVTDSSRLDVAPRLELIDAVDVDGDNIGELLFRQYSFDEKSFVIYRIGRSTVSKIFEGASQPLK